MDFVASRELEQKHGWRVRIGQVLREWGGVVFDPWGKPDIRGLRRPSPPCTLSCGSLREYPLYMESGRLIGVSAAGNVGGSASGVGDPDYRHLRRLFAPKERGRRKWNSQPDPVAITPDIGVFARWTAFANSFWDLFYRGRSVVYCFDIKSCIGMNFVVVSSSSF